MKFGGRANKLMDHKIAHVNKPSVILIFNDEAAKQSLSLLTLRMPSTNSLGVYDWFLSWANLRAFNST
jgi:hypothetical protein